MRIAVNVRCLTNPDMGGGYYTFHLIRQIIEQHPEHSFQLYSDAPVSSDFPSNAKTIVIGKPCHNLVALRHWLDVKIRKALSTWNADLFISLDGTGCLTTKVRQVIGITDLQFIDRAKVPQRFIKKYFTQKTFNRSALMITVSQAIKKNISSRFLIPDEKIIVIPKAPRSFFKPIDYHEKESIRSAHADGKEYFLFTGGFDATKNLLNVLKGFSQFKKWQQSEMKLLVAGDTSNDPVHMMEKIRTFRFREDVVLMDKIQPKQLGLLMGAAYALIYAAKNTTYGMPVLEAMRSATAVITSDNIGAEIPAETVLYTTPNNAATIGEQMIRLYKDEDLRNQLAEAGRKYAMECNWETSAAQLWREIEKIAAVNA